MADRRKTNEGIEGTVEQFPLNYRNDPKGRPCKKGDLIVTSTGIEKVADRDTSWRWHVRLWDDAGNRVSYGRKTRTQKEAKAALKACLEKRGGKRLLPSDTSPTVGSYANEWLDKLGRKETTVSTYRDALNHYICPSVDGRYLGDPYVGNVKLGDLTWEHVRDLVQHWAVAGADCRVCRGGASRTPCKPCGGTGLVGIEVGTARKALGLFRQIIDHAMINKKVASNAVAELPKALRPSEQIGFRVSPPKRTQWSVETAEWFLQQTSSDRLHALFTVALYSGLRRGELAGLRWSDLDLSGRVVTIQNNRTTAGSKVVEHSVKGKVKVVRMEIPEPMAVDLELWQKEQQAELDVLGMEPAVYVFTTERGAPERPENLGKRWERQVKANGLPYISLHGARHTGARMVYEITGHNEEAVMRFLRHSHIAVTLNYVNEHNFDETPVANPLGTVMAGPGSTPRPPAHLHVVAS